MKTLLEYINKTRRTNYGIEPSVIDKMYDMDKWLRHNGYNEWEYRADIDFDKEFMVKGKPAFTKYCWIKEPSVGYKIIPGWKTGASQYYISIFNGSSSIGIELTYSTSGEIGIFSTFDKRGLIGHSARDYKSIIDLTTSYLNEK